MMSYRDHPIRSHIWLMVTHPGDDKHVAVGMAGADRDMNLVQLGYVTSKAEYYLGIIYNPSAQFSMLHQNEGMQIVPGRAPSVLDQP